MILNTNFIKKYSSIFSKVTSSNDFFFLNVLEKKLYFSTNQIIGKLDLKDSIQDSDSFNKKSMIFPRDQFLYLCSYFDSFEIQEDYTYKSINTKGKFNTNEIILEELDSIESIFSSEHKYEHYLTFDVPLLNLFTKALYFTNNEDRNIQSQAIHVKNNKICSSSNYRIYVNECNLNIDTIIHNSIIRNAISLGDNTILSKYDKTFLLKNDVLSLIFTDIDNIDFFPYFDDKSKFTEVLNNLEKDENRYVVSVHDFLEKLSFISFYALKEINGMTFLTFSDKSTILSVKENSIILNDPLVSQNENMGSISFPFNLKLVKEALDKVVSKEMNDISIYVDNATNIFIIKISEMENIIFSKIAL